MIKKANFFTPCVTLFDEKGDVDVEANRRAWENEVKGGVSGIVVLGSIGEFFAMSMEQKRLIIAEAAAFGKGRTKVYAGTNCTSVAETIELSNYALECGVDGVMVISPYYFTLSDVEVEAYYDEVADGVNGPIFLYNFPDRTGYDLAPKVALNLLRKHKNIVGYKDTVPLMAHTRELIELTKKEFPDFMVLSGYDEFFAHNLMAGGSGCISGLSNIYPEAFGAWIKAADAHDYERMAAIQQLVDRLMDIYAVNTPFIPTIKAAMAVRGIVKGCDGSQKPFGVIRGEKLETVKAICADVDAQAKALGIL